MTRKTVAIRGLDTGLYNEVFSMAKKVGKRVCDVVNPALKAFINGDTPTNSSDDTFSNSPNSGLNGNFVLTVDDEGEVTLSKNDLLEISREMGPFRIECSGTLIMDKDVDSESLRGLEKIIIKSGQKRKRDGMTPAYEAFCNGAQFFMHRSDHREWLITITLDDFIRPYGPELK